MKLKEKLWHFKEAGRGILAANFYNFETLSGILMAAQQLNEPIILQVSESSIKYMGLPVTLNLARSGMEQYKVESWLHLDHGASPELAEACLKAGFDSVMIDASEQSLEDNIRLTQKVTSMAKQFGAMVEAELGYIPKLGQQDSKEGFTTPEAARDFVQITGVDALAIAIGTAHGFYKEEPKLDFDRLQKIAAITPAVLVLHGGSGVPDAALRKAISLGITKINLATDSKNAFMKQLKSELLHSEEIDLRKTFPPATNAVRNLIRNKMQLVSMDECMPLG
jgi:fructose-bisphosphate aldolase class II/tagatose 1,6-diphosphate aldolase GatY/KbaY